MVRLSHNEQAFTLIEVLVIAPILMLTIVVLMTFLFNQYGQLTQQGALINLQTEAQNITFSMQDDIFFADSFEQNMNANLADAYDPPAGWTYNTNPSTLIISTPALTGNRRSANRTPVYINTVGCDQAVIEENSPLMNNVIYFASGTTLYKRIISAPNNMATCGTSYQKQTCPAANATTSCPPDRVITKNLSKFTLKYYDANNVAVTDPSIADKVQIDLELKDKAFAEDIYATSNITLKKLNQ